MDSFQEKVEDLEERPVLLSLIVISIGFFLYGFGSSPEPKPEPAPMIMTRLFSGLAYAFSPLFTFSIGAILYSLFRYLYDLFKSSVVILSVVSLIVYIFTLPSFW
jgi:hypothetical protein